MLYKTVLGSCSVRFLNSLYGRRSVSEKICAICGKRGISRFCKALGAILKTESGIDVTPGFDGSRNDEIPMLHDECRKDPIFEVFAREVMAGKTPSNVRVTVSQIRKFMQDLFALGFETMSPDKAADAVRTLMTRYSQERTKNTVKARRQCMVRFFTWLNEKRPGSVSTAVFDALKMPRIVAPENIPVILEPEEVDLALMFASTYEDKLWRRHQFYLFVALGVFMGLRPHELLRLEWSEIHMDFNPPWLAITNLPNRKMKNSRAGQKMEIPEMLRPAFAILKQTSGPIFPQGADPATIDTHRKPIKKLRKSCNMPHFNTLVMRHTFCTYAARSGVSEQMLIQMTRHKDTTTLNQYYIRRPDVISMTTGEGIKPIQLHGVLQNRERLEHSSERL